MSSSQNIAWLHCDRAADHERGAAESGDTKDKFHDSQGRDTNTVQAAQQAEIQRLHQQLHELKEGN